MSDLVKFLTARLDEDEAAAKAAHFRAGDHWDDGEAVLFPEIFAYIARFDPARVLREVEAGRRILARHGYCDHGGWNGSPLCPDLADLLAVYSGHPDYPPSGA